MIRLFVLQIIIIFLFLPNNSIATNQNVFDDAKIYFEKKDYNQSKFLFQKYLVFNPKDYLSYLYLAKIYKEEDNKNETEKNLNTTLLLNPITEEALFMLIELQLERSNFSKAKELNEKFLKVELNNEIYGFIKKINLSRDKNEQKTDRFAIGEQVDSIILSVDQKNRSLNLSIKEIEIIDEKEAMSKYGSSDSGASLGDILGSVLKNKK